MTRKINNKIKHIAKRVKLTDKDKQTIRNSIIEYSKIHPIQTQSKKRAVFNFATFLYQPRVVIASLLIVLLFSSSGVAFASQYALPGDTLYPVKLLTENISEKIAITQSQKDSRLISHAQQRVAELETLLQKKHIDTRLQEKLLLQAQRKIATASFAKYLQEGSKKDEKNTNNKNMRVHLYSLQMVRAQKLHKKILTHLARIRGTKKIHITEKKAPITAPASDKKEEKERGKKIQRVRVVAQPAKRVVNTAGDTKRAPAKALPAPLPASSAAEKPHQDSSTTPSVYKPGKYKNIERERKVNQKSGAKKPVIKHKRTQTDNKNIWTRIKKALSTKNIQTD